MAIVAPRFLGTTEWDVKHLVVNGKIYFSGKDVGETLECKNPRQACRLAVKEKYRCRLGELVDPASLDKNEKTQCGSGSPESGNGWGLPKCLKLQPSKTLYGKSACQGSGRR